MTCDCIRQIFEASLPVQLQTWKPEGQFDAVQSDGQASSNNLKVCIKWNTNVATQTCCIVGIAFYQCILRVCRQYPTLCLRNPRQSLTSEGCIHWGSIGSQGFAVGFIRLALIAAILPLRMELGKLQSIESLIIDQIMVSPYRIVMQFAIDQNRVVSANEGKLDSFLWYRKRRE